MKTDLVNLGIGQGAAIAVLGYAVVFLGLVLLKAKKEAAVQATSAAPAAASVPEAAPTRNLPAAPGSAGELKLYDTDPRDAAMIMAIVADTLGKPLNELRFKSNREVKEDEI